MSKTIPAPSLPKVTMLSARTVRDRYPGLDQMSIGGLDELPDFLIGAYKLSRGSVFKVDERFATPVAFVHPSHRTHVVLAREKGDLEWPAWLHSQRVQAVPAIMARIRRGLADFYARTPQSFYDEKERQREAAAAERAAQAEAAAEAFRKAQADADLLDKLDQMEELL